MSVLMVLGGWRSRPLAGPHTGPRALFNHDYIHSQPPVGSETRRQLERCAGSGKAWPRRLKKLHFHKPTFVVDFLLRAAVSARLFPLRGDASDWSSKQFVPFRF